jgi:phosphoglycolate phosphatase-like HAD superfamily hydrolase
MNHKTLVIFDVDGTLVYSNRADSRTFAATYQNIYRKPFPSIDWLKYPHVTDTTIIEHVIQDHFGRKIEWEEVSEFIQMYEEGLRESRRIAPDRYMEVPHARRVLEYLLENEYSVAIATGGWEGPARIKLEHIKAPVAQLHIGAADRKYTRESIIESVVELKRKEKPDIERIVYVGDALWDVRTTRNMGMNLIGVRVHGDRELLQEQGVRHVISHYEDLEGFEQALAEAEPPGRGPEAKSYALFE